MFGSVVLDVAIGLSLLFLFVSLICSAIREGIETLVNMRAADLERGLRELLDDPTGTGPVQALYDHPLVFSLYRGHYRPARLVPHRSLFGGLHGLTMPVRARFSLPAYIPAANFARAFLDLTLRGPVGAGVPGGVEPALAGQAPLVLTVASLAAKAQALPDGRIRRALLVALDTADGDIERVQAGLELWFDSCMDRVSGWYKRRTQVILFVIGVGVAGVMNIDAFSVGRALFQDKALRDGAVSQAASLVPRDAGDLPRMAQEGFAALQDDLDRIQFPTGWEPAPQHLRRTTPLPAGAGWLGRTDWMAVAQMLIGWAVTGFSVMLGAPFWFDMLNRFMIVRSTIKPGQFAPSLR